MNIEDISKSLNAGHARLLDAQSVLTLMNQSFEIAEAVDLSTAADVVNSIVKEVTLSLDKLDTRMRHEAHMKHKQELESVEVQS